MDVPKDKYCSCNVTLETCWAFYIELEPLDDERTAFMFWRGDKPLKGFTADKQRVRDIRPGDSVGFNGKLRKVARVQIYR
jgi:hypothetical protein